MSKIIHKFLKVSLLASIAGTGKHNARDIPSIRDLYFESMFQIPTYLFLKAERVDTKSRMFFFFLFAAPRLLYGLGLLFNMEFAAAVTPV